MGKRIRDYVKYSLSELENYTKTEGSCVKKINTSIHLNFPPYGLSNFRQTLLNIIAQNKIGFYDSQLKGIILDIKNIKVLGDIGALRFDDPAIHLNIQADCYVFQPQIGAEVRGMVKHISHRQIGIIIYRVFSVSIKLSEKINAKIELNSDIEFRIKKFDLQNVMPFIEGEFVRAHGHAQKRQNTITKIEDIKDNGEEHVKPVQKFIKIEISDSESENFKMLPIELQRKHTNSDNIHPEKTINEHDTKKFAINKNLIETKIHKSLSPDLFEDDSNSNDLFIANQEYRKETKSEKNAIQKNNESSSISSFKSSNKEITNGFKTETYEISDSDSDNNNKQKVSRKRKISMTSIHSDTDYASSSNHSKRKKRKNHHEYGDNLPDSINEENRFKKSTTFSKILNRNSSGATPDLSQNIKNETSTSNEFKIPFNDSSTSTKKKKSKYIGSDKEESLDTSNDVRQIISIDVDDADNSNSITQKHKKKLKKKDKLSKISDSLDALFAQIKSQKS